MKAITVHISGGLGNQMFQYAMGRALSLRLGLPLRLDISWFNNISTEMTPRDFQLLLFPNLPASIEITEVGHSSLWRKIIGRLNQSFLGGPRRGRAYEVVEPHFEYWDGVEKLSGPAYLRGYWQSEKYFSFFHRQICQDFTPPPLPDGMPRDIEMRIRNCPNAVSVHIRRGDYVSNPKTSTFHGVLGEGYYRTALDRIRERDAQATLFLFSDAPQWVQENFDPCGHDAVVVDTGLPEPHHDMQLMSLCKHHILANSSFSWWGAWLDGGKGMTLAPAKWFADTTINTADLCPPSWIRI